MKIFKILLLSMFLFIAGSISVNADTATGSVTVNVLLSCTPPLTQDVTVACDGRDGFTVTGSVIRTQTKDPVSCLFGTPITNENSTYVDDSCVYTPSLCPAPLTREAVFDCDPMVGFKVTGSITRTQTKDPTTCLFSDPITGSNSSIKNNACIYTPTGGDENCINGATNPPLCNNFGNDVDCGYGPWINPNGIKCGDTFTQTRIFTEGQNNGDKSCSTEPLSREVTYNQCVDIKKIDVMQGNKKLNNINQNITDKKIIYNSKVKVLWEVENASGGCKCTYLDNSGKSGLCGSVSPYSSPALKIDTIYSLSCSGIFGIEDTGFVKVLVDKINPDYLEN